MKKKEGKLVVKTKNADSLLDLDPVKMKQREEFERLQKLREDREQEEERIYDLASKDFIAWKKDKSILEPYKSKKPLGGFSLIRIYSYKIPKENSIELFDLAGRPLSDPYDIKIYPVGKVLVPSQSNTKNLKPGDTVDVRDDISMIINNKDWVDYKNALKDSAYEETSGYIPPEQITVLESWRANYGYKLDRLRTQPSEEDLFTFLVPDDFLRVAE